MDQTTIRTQAYILTLQDHLHYHLIALGRQFTKWPVAAITWGTCIGFPLLLALPSLMASHYVSAAMVAAPILLLYTVFIPALGFWRTYRAVKTNPTMRGSRVATLDDRQFSIEGEGFAVHQQWSNFSELIETRDKVFLVLRGTALALPVRKDAFTDVAILTAFIQTAKAHIAAGRHAQVRAFEEPLIAAPVEGVVSPPFILTFPRFAIYYLFILYLALFRPLPLIILVGGFTGMSAWFGRYALMAGDWSPIAPGLEAALGFLVVFPLFMVFIAWFVTQRVPTAKVMRTISVSSSGMRARSDSFDNTIQWSSVRAVTRRFGMLFIWSGRYVATVVPLSIFPDKAQAKAFHSQTLTYWRAAKSPATE